MRFVPWRVAPNSWTQDFSPASAVVVLLVWPALFALVFFGPLGLIAVAAIPLTIWMGIRLIRLLRPSTNAHELRPCLECGADTLSPTELCPTHRHTTAAAADER